jgi:CDP-glycerol glycerophosphotransferase
MIINKYSKFTTIFKIVVGWIFVIPFSLLIPKKRNLIIIIGSEKGFFRDNSKYFFIEINKTDDFQAYFLTEKKEVFSDLIKNFSNILQYPSAKAIIKLLRAKFIIVDDHHWFKKFKFYFSYGSKKIQLWHGTGIKYVEIMNKAEKYKTSLKRKIISILSGRFPKYDIVISSSDYFAEIFYKKSFRTKNIITSGYPRNDVLFVKNLNREYLIGVDKSAVENLVKLKKTGWKIIIYMPTFRDKSNKALLEKAINYEKLNKFLMDKKTVFIVKHHYSVEFNSFNRFENIIVYHHQKDIYPFLSYSDLLVTDYSSVFFDYLLLNKPIIFYLFDLENYLKEDRGLYLDVNDVLPGKIVYKYQSLIEEIDKILFLSGEEKKWKIKREKILELSFKYKDGNSAKRIISKLSKRN